MSKDLCLQSIDHCKRFQPIAERLGIEPDYYWIKFTEYKSQEFGLYKEKTYRDHEDDIVIPTYRQDKLELPLPDWVFTGRLPLSMSNDIDSITIGEDAYHQYQSIGLLQGEPKRKATVELVELLDKEGLL